MYNILILDDEDYICKLISKVAQKKGHETEVFYNYEEALKLINNEKSYDFAFIDFHLDKFKINDLIKQLKRINPDCKIIIMSGVQKDEININIEYDKYIFKPELIDTIYQIL